MLVEFFVLLFTDVFSGAPMREAWLTASVSLLIVLCQHLTGVRHHDRQGNVVRYLRMIDRRRQSLRNSSLAVAQVQNDFGARPGIYIRY